MNRGGVLEVQLNAVLLFHNPYSTNVVHLRRFVCYKVVVNNAHPILEQEKFETSQDLIILAHVHGTFISIYLSLSHMHCTVLS